MKSTNQKPEYQELTKDQWIQVAKSLLFDITLFNEPSSLTDKAEFLIEVGGGYNYREENAVTELRWKPEDETD